MRPLARLVWLIAGLWLAQAAPSSAASAFGDWSAVVIAGDWHTHSGGPSEAFDNARRDVARAFEQAGFESQNLRQFSVRPERYKDTNPAKSDPQGIYDALSDLTARATGGCLIYFSSHGMPQGVVVDQQLLPPGVLAGMLDSTCGARPTVVIISACFSGVFVPALAGANRMVLTAARPDRSSFGCGEADKYPYFDQCVLESMPSATDFATLGRTVQACVAAREVREGMKPPSEPQLFIGSALKPLLPLYSLASTAPRKPAGRN
ncbi:C13 family peptidase [Phenylobacterium sp.]|uniref:C13 family peptidase n=1 Tax=Phenylobacterium sp. TaxID=1871053 RepID=UPI002E33A1F4|nr:C13 family peptidase [Phenylobacterium sp.]HEX4712415.1 C13 family peptidase [Phenylobacterium sp.]